MLNSGEGPFRCFAAIGDNRPPKSRVLFVSEGGLMSSSAVAEVFAFLRISTHAIPLALGARAALRGDWGQSSSQIASVVYFLGRADVLIRRCGGFRFPSHLNRCDTACTKGSRRPLWRLGTSALRLLSFLAEVGLADRLVNLCRGHIYGGISFCVLLHHSILVML
jgi:hypothetical protein